MARSLNKVMLIGNVGNEPEIRMTASGAKVAKISVATNRKYQDRTGQQQEKTEWHRCTLFGKLADIAEQWVHKGDRIYVEGRLEYSQTQDEQGGTRYWTDVVIMEMVMLGSGGSGGGVSGGQSQGGYESAPAAPVAPAKPLTEPDDDLPF